MRLVILFLGLLVLTACENPIVSVQTQTECLELFTKLYGDEATANLSVTEKAILTARECLLRGDQLVDASTGRTVALPVDSLVVNE